MMIGSDEPAQTSDGRPRFVGCTDLHKLFDRDTPVHRMQVTRQMLRHHRRPELDQYRLLVNLITDPDQNPKVLEVLRKLLRDARGQVLNPPEAVLRTTRDQVARRLAGVAGLIAPRVLRLASAKADVATRAVDRAGLAFPLILRRTGTHTGRILGLCRDMDEVRSALADSSGEHVVTEFVEFRSGDGHYRKYRAFFIGRRIVFRHMLASDQWNVHAKDRRGYMADRPDLLSEEERMFDRPEGAFPDAVVETLERVREAMGLDYFGMDFGIVPDGRVLLFEANPTMNFFPFLDDPRFAYVQRCLEPAREAFREMIGAAENGRASGLAA